MAVLGVVKRCALTSCNKELSLREPRIVLEIRRMRPVTSLSFWTHLFLQDINQAEFCQESHMFEYLRELPTP